MHACAFASIFKTYLLFYLFIYIFSPVNCLSERITTLVKERKVLTGEIHVLHEEKKALQGRCEDLSNQIRSMVSPEYMKKIINEHEM